MLSYLFKFIHAFIPVSLLTGLLLALLRPVDGQRAVRCVVIGIAAGLLAGIAVYWLALRQETLTAARIFLYGAAILAALGNGGAVLLPKKRSGALPGWGGELKREGLHIDKKDMWFVVGGALGALALLGLGKTSQQIRPAGP